ncbi:probable protein phosphatase 2C 33 isoform X2 [Magnolia sinica]|uniref:probable protein phosphatase 2C 33 isoform X2 n=1 Tax=Magnolia sinica TaxID=86752 RepID=UPI002658834D|nr:probable protein phosphatase 2C 33 isoform X2 [Magnolia sinica]
MGSCLSVDGRSSLPHSTSSASGVGKQRRKSRKKQGMRNSSFVSKAEEDQLHRVPGRMFLNGASGVASMFTQQGRKGTNQDAMIVWENFGSRTDTVFCGVFDGHGPYGHFVARRVRDSLPLKLSAHWEVNIGGDDGLRENNSSAAGSMNSEETTSLFMDDELRASVDLEEKEKHPEIFLTLKESFMKAFKVMDKELRLHPSIDCFCSGTTAVTLVKQGQDLIIGNIGDSRAILGTRDQDDSLVAVQLTVDLKPNLPREAERIRQCRGRVFALQDEPEVARVWLPNNDSPGLAMARAFGDFCLKDFGLISVPEISYRRLTEKDEFIVLATDGIWDVLSNKEVVDIVASAPARSSAARALVESAVRAWRFKYPTSKVDDCAVVCLFLDSNPDTGNSKRSVEGLDMANEKQEDPLEWSATVRTCNEIVPEEGGEASKLLGPTGGAADEWLALEGVSRVNTLLTLPRFVAGGDQKRPEIQKSSGRNG